MKKMMILMMVALMAIPMNAQPYRRHHYPQRPRTYYKSPSRYSHYNSRELHGPIGQYFGLRIGGNLATISSDDIYYDMDSYGGFTGGFVYGFQTGYRSPVWMELGFNYSEKGGIARDDYGKVKYRLGYLQMPIVTKFDIGIDELRIQPFMGGYVAAGIAGRAKEADTHYSWSAYDEFNRFDGGLRVGCGVAFDMLYAEMGFDFGLANISQDEFNAAHTRTFFINMGLNF